MSTGCAETLTITHRSGLHARASTEFVRLSQRFESAVFLSRPGGDTVDGKSIIAILTLGAQLGDEITIRVEGADQGEALDALVDLVKSDFHGA
ncbi:MAG TPA: HPr family phosphocarrier protein [Planctomycetes bacterium]|nr:HPr family phosphocarrier protein [Planctomycetota bacterium]HIN79641.1 HPr family phosphocarrier protein [Planctomycetota bacterium]